MSCGQTGFGVIGDALRDVFEAQLKLGKEILGAFDLTKTSTGDSCCQIPEPCWMPRSAGELTSVACAGGSTSLKVRIRNIDVRPRNMVVKAAATPSIPLTVDPPNLPLGAQQRGTVSVKAELPNDSVVGQEYEVIVWVHGCRYHYLRWTVTVGEKGGACAKTVDLEDGPDLVHHWYDHFYCRRQCFGDVVKVAIDRADG